MLWILHVSLYLDISLKHISCLIFYTINWCNIEIINVVWHLSIFLHEIIYIFFSVKRFIKLSEKKLDLKYIIIWSQNRKQWIYCPKNFVMCKCLDQYFLQKFRAEFKNKSVRKSKLKSNISELKYRRRQSLHCYLNTILFYTWNGTSGWTWSRKTSSRINNKSSTLCSKDTCKQSNKER